MPRVIKDKRSGVTYTDRLIKYCIECRNCWQTKFKIEKRGDNCKKGFIYYKDFPSYGKVKEICPDCKVKKETRDG